MTQNAIFLTQKINTNKVMLNVKGFSKTFIQKTAETLILTESVPVKSY